MFYREPVRLDAPGARVEMVRWMKERVSERAKERQAEYHGNQYQSAVLLKSAEVQKSDTRDVLAKLAGVGHDTFTKSEYVPVKKNNHQHLRRVILVVEWQSNAGEALPVEIIPQENDIEHK